MHRIFSPKLLVPLALATQIAACSSSSHSGPGSGPADAAADAGQDDASVASIPFEPEPASVYLTKVKNLLVGLPATDLELQSVTADPSQLKSLVQQWMKLPQYEKKMARFFELAFQQTQVSAVDFDDQAYPNRLVNNAAFESQFAQNAQQSFARTMLALVAQGRPFTEAVTTKKFMMTTALKETYAFLDAWQVGNDGKPTDRLKASLPKVQIVVEANQGPIPIAETLDPKSPLYMHWYNPDVPTSGKGVAGCGQDPIVYPFANAMALHHIIFGSLDGYPGAGSVKCPPSGGSAAAVQFVPTDFSDWTLVTVRPPKPGEATTAFYDLPTLRAATELVLAVPRTGFFSTPAFFANWQTNISNQMRVTMNQTLIVALGAQVDGSDSTLTPGDPPPGLDKMHAVGGCNGCHQTLDPLRSVFSSNFSWNYHNQTDPVWKSQPGIFSFQNVIQPVTSMDDLGATLAQHPLFESAWVQKLCYYANSAPCEDSDPEFKRIVNAFKASHDSWEVLIAELFSSPLVTNVTATQTTTNHGEVIAVSRRDHLCAALNSRLGFADICGLSLSAKQVQKSVIPEIASGMPSDGYGRGATIPVLPNQPTLFYRAAIENICEAVAAQVIDVPPAKADANTKAWSSAAADDAISEFVSLIMALPQSDARFAPAVALLKEHFAAAKAQKASATDALKSTFVAACLAPSAISIGL